MTKKWQNTPETPGQRWKREQIELLGRQRKAERIKENRKRYARPRSEYVSRYSAVAHLRSIMREDSK